MTSRPPGIEIRPRPPRCPKSRKYRWSGAAFPAAPRNPWDHATVLAPQLDSAAGASAAVQADLLEERAGWQTVAEAFTIPPGDIERTEVAPISPMPEGLLESLIGTELRDLMGCLIAK